MDQPAQPPPAPTAPPRALGPAGQVAAFGALYLALAWVGDVLSTGQGDFASFWPASGLLVAALLLARRAEWRWYALVVLAAELLGGLAMGRAGLRSLAYGAADLLEGLVAALAAGALVGGPLPGPRRLRWVLAVAIGGPCLGSVVGALFGVTAELVLYGPAKVDLGPDLLRWWAGSALGVLVVAPAVLAWRVPARHGGPWTAQRSAEAVLLAAAGGLVGLLVFGGGAAIRLDRGYLLLPVLGWAALRFGVRGVSLLGAAMALLSAAAVSRGLSAAGAGEADVQLYLGFTVAAALLFAASLEDRTEAEAGRGESEALFEAFLANSPAALFILDGAGALVRASRAFERMMGRPAPDLLGQTAAEAMPGREGRAAAAEDAAILATGAPVRVDRKLAGRVQDIVKFRIDREGRPPLVGGVAVDVTEQRLALRSLRLAQEALDRAFTALLFVEPSGLVTYANQAAGRLLGRPPAELVGRSAWDLGGSFDEASWPEAWRRLREQGAMLLEGRVGVPGGTPVEVELGLSHVAFDGQQYAVLAARDLTERRQAEAAQRLAAVGTLAAGMAHEVNNPLTFVAANLAFALDRLGPLRADPRAEEVAHALEDAEEGTRRVARVVRDLKAVSRVDPSDRRPVDLRAEVETALKLAQGELRHRARVVEVLDAVPPVAAPEFQLGQVVLNLLVNAAHAIEEGDAARQEVRVATRTAPDGWAVVEVADTGGGIPPEVRARIFEPFFTTKPLGQGTGLGLSVCHGIVTGLGGRIEVESEPGRGTTFRVLLPPAEAVSAGEAAPAAAPPRAEGGKARILVVDDEALICATVRRLLSAHEVVALTDPREALARLRGGEPFDLVLCDLMMPGLSGMDLHAALAAERPDVARRMVFMTGGAFTERARAFLEQAGSPSLGKPFAPQDLRDAVRGWLAAGPGAAPGGPGQPPRG